MYRHIMMIEYVTIILIENVVATELMESEKWLIALTLKNTKIWWFGFTLVWLIDACIGVRNRLMELWLQQEIR